MILRTIWIDVALRGDVAPVIFFIELFMKQFKFMKFESGSFFSPYLLINYNDVSFFWLI